MDDALEPGNAAPRPLRRRRVVLAGVVVAVMTAAGTAIGLSVTSGTREPAAPPSLPPVARIDPATQVFHDGDRVEGQGKVLAVDGRPVLFCAPVAETSEAGNEEAHARSCADAVEVTGLDLTALTDPVTFPGLLAGTAHLVGTWQDGRLVDVAQEPVVAAAPYVGPQTPCAAPAGGWPRGTADADLDVSAAEAYQAAHPGVVLTIAQLRPSATQVLAYVLTTGDPAPVRAALAPRLGPALCVAQSRYTPAELAAAAAAVDVGSPMWDDAHVYSAGGAGNIGADAQPEFSVELPRVTDEVMGLIRDLAPGLVQFTPWLTPASAGVR